MLSMVFIVLLYGLFYNQLYFLIRIFMPVLHVYIGTTNDYPDIDFDSKYPEILYHFSTYYENFDTVVKTANHVLTQSADFIRFLSSTRPDREIIYHINGKTTHDNDLVRSELLEFYQSMMLLDWANSDISNDD